MQQKLKENIVYIREQLTKMLADRELLNDEVYEVSVKLDKLIVEYQRGINRGKHKNITF